MPNKVKQLVSDIKYKEVVYMLSFFQYIHTGSKEKYYHINVRTILITIKSIDISYVHACANKISATSNNM